MTRIKTLEEYVKYDSSNNAVEIVTYFQAVQEPAFTNDGNSFHGSDDCMFYRLHDYEPFISSNNLNSIHSETDYDIVNSEDYELVRPGVTGTIALIKYTFSSKEGDDLAAAKTTEWKLVRRERDKRLAATDWVPVKALENNETIPEAWITYRQALRDITTQDDPFNITWPNAPE